MGNFVSCSFVQVEKHTAKLIDLHGNLRRINLPLTAAELMLEELGHMVSSAEDVRRCSRLSAMKADEELSAGKIYVLVPVGKIHSKLSGSEMALIMSSCTKRRVKQRTSKVLPAVVICAPNEEVESPTEVSVGDEVKAFQCPRLRPWTPSLEPVLEEDC